MLPYEKQLNLKILMEFWGRYGSCLWFIKSPLAPLFQRGEEKDPHDYAKTQYLPVNQKLPDACIGYCKPSAWTFMDWLWQGSGCLIFEFQKTAEGHRDHRGRWYSDTERRKQNRRLNDIECKFEVSFYPQMDCESFKGRREEGEFTETVIDKNK